ncbi:MAG: hypothetical protein GX607_08870 [Myxococcales bacterium]|jgi:uncharacterized protein YndB with AHSA1/START domain|nr:hypothetical protein [Myxococcales bacterium]
MGVSVHVSQAIEASKESAWRAISEAASVARWQSDTARGGLTEGFFVLGWPSLGVELSLDVHEVDPGERLVLCNGDARLELRVTDGRVDLWHRGLAPEDDLEGMRASWQVALGVLAHYLKRHEGQDRHVRWALRSMRTQAEIAHVFFTDRTALGSWLTRGDGGVGEVGSAVRCTSHWGSPLRGEVLVRHPGRDVALRLDEPTEGVLVCRTLPSPTSTTDRLVALVWSRWEPPSAPPHADPLTPEHLSTALGRLKLVLESPGGA